MSTDKYTRIFPLQMEAVIYIRYIGYQFILTGEIKSTFQFVFFYFFFFHNNNYNADFINRNIYRPSESDATNKNPTPTTVTISSIKVLLRRKFRIFFSGFSFGNFLFRP